MNYVYGLLTLPAIWIALTIIGILYRTTRDTYRRLRGATFKEGYSRWNWFWVVPSCWCYSLKDQCWSWWHGIETEVR